MNFTEQDALKIAQQFCFPDDDYEPIINYLMTTYHLGIEKGMSVEVKQAYWDGVKAGIKRYSYIGADRRTLGMDTDIYVGPPADHITYINQLQQKYFVGTTTLRDALNEVEREAQEALKRDHS